jgi:hypothetical protein
MSHIPSLITVITYIISRDPLRRGIYHSYHLLPCTRKRKPLRDLVPLFVLGTLLLIHQLFNIKLTACFHDRTLYHPKAYAIFALYNLPYQLEVFIPLFKGSVITTWPDRQ